MRNRFISFFILLIVFGTVSPLEAQVSFGEAQKMNKDWLFSLSDETELPIHHSMIVNGVSLIYLMTGRSRGSYLLPWQVVLVIYLEESDGIVSILRYKIVHQDTIFILKELITAVKCI